MVVLDEEDRVVEAGPAGQARVSLDGCASALEELPSARALFAPYFERARRTGEPVGFAEFVDGRVVQVEVVPGGGRLVVTWHTLCILDVLTLTGLRQSLQVMLDTLAAAEETLRRAEVRAGLRLLEGGG